VRKALKTNERSTGRRGAQTKRSGRRLGKQKTRRNDRQREDLEARGNEELVRGHAALKMTILMSRFLQFSEEEIDANVSQLKTSAARANCEVRVMYGQQD
jgi:hypothetical protein